MQLRKIIASSLIASLLASPLALAQTNFADVPDDHKAKVAIDYLVSKGVISGFGDGTFKPDDPFSRAQGLKVILEALDINLKAQNGEFTLNAGDVINVGNDKITISQDGTKVNYVKQIKLPQPNEDEMLSGLKDLNLGAWYVKPIQIALRVNLATGRNDGTFGPDDQLSLAALLTILARAAKINNPDLVIDKNILPDYLEKDSWYAEGIAFGLKEKLIGIAEGKRLAPFYELNRGEAIIIIYNYVVLSQKNTDSKVSVVTESSAVTTTEKVVEETKEIGSELAKFTETGIASYYGKSFDGAKTASGELLDTEAFQAAHKTLPFNTIIKITNTDTGKWVKARVVDRGPFTEGRIVDLTPSAFEAIATLSSGLAPVKVEVESLP